MHGRPDEVQQLLASLVPAISNGIDRILVIDNGYESLDVVPEGVFVYSVQNRGFGAAVNTGIQLSKANVILVLNPDLLLEDCNVIVSLANRLAMDPCAGACAPVIVDETGRPDDCIFTRTPTAKRLFFSALLPSWSRWSVRRDLDRQVGVSSLPGACFAVRSEVFHSIGGFDESFFLYFEDADLFRRIRRSGHKLVLHRDLRVRHRGGSSMGSDSRRRDFHRQGQYTYLRKWNGWPVASSFRLLVWIEQLLRPLAS